MSDILKEQEEDESQSNEYENILPQALPVADLPKNTDLNVPPSTGEDYLSRVRYSKILMLFRHLSNLRFYIIFELKPNFKELGELELINSSQI